MKDLISQLFSKKRSSRELTQEELTAFIFKKSTIEKAAYGSMKKRDELIQSVDLAHGS